VAAGAVFVCSRSQLAWAALAAAIKVSEADSNFAPIKAPIERNLIDARLRRAIVGTGCWRRPCTGRTLALAAPIRHG
jgi:hypothetical protein